jgi:hypothetical protein
MRRANFRHKGKMFLIDSQDNRIGRIKELLKDLGRKGTLLLTQTTLALEKGEEM